METRQHSTPAAEAARLTRRSMLRLSALAGGSAVILGAAPGGRTSAASVSPSADCSPAGALPSAITAIMRKPRYAGATWNLLVVDTATGETLYELRPDDM